MDVNGKGNLFDDEFYEIFEGEKELEPTSFGKKDQAKISLKQISDDEEVDSGDASVQDMFADTIMTIPTALYQSSEPQQEDDSFDRLFNILIGGRNRPIQPTWQQKKQDPALKSIMSQSVFSENSKNALRFLVDLLIEYLPECMHQYSKEASQKMLELCSQTKEWHLEQKKNVYNRFHLRLFFGDEDNVARENSAKTRKLFNMILRTKVLEAMKKPKSQIKNKVHYLTVTKIFSFRCRSKILSLRNQSR